MVTVTLHRTSAVICLLLLAGAPALADQTTDAMKKAEALYRQGSLGKAFTQLEEAATLVARQLAARYAKTFPPAPSGWRAQPVTSSAEGKTRVGRGIVLRRNYVQNGGRGRATAKLIVDNQGIIAAVKGLKRAEVHAKRTKRAIVPIDGVGNAFVKFDESRGVGDLYIFVSGRFYITLSAQNVESRANLTRMLSSWNFAGLKKAAGMD